MKSLCYYYYILIAIIFLAASESKAQWVQTTQNANSVVTTMAVKDSDVYEATYGGFYHSTNNGIDWTSVSSITSYVTGISFNDNKIFVSTNSQGICVSTNNGIDWSSIGPSGLPFYCLTIKDGNIFTGSMTPNVYRSTNNGITWDVVNHGLFYSEFAPNEIRGLIVFNNNIYLSLETFGIYYTTNDGTHWVDFSNGLYYKIKSPKSRNNLLVYLYTYSFATCGTKLFAGNYHGIYFISENDTSWTQVNNGLTDAYISSLTSIGNKIFAGTFGGNVFLSTNNGTNWTLETDGLVPGHGINSLTANDSYVYAADGDGVVWRRSLTDFNLPVELTRYTSSIKSNNITLNWITATELNASKFEIERKYSAAVWNKIGEITAAGNSTSQKSYSYTDSKLAAGKYTYRLKIVDLDGTFKYSNEIQADISVPKDFSLSQNYPNPFNPTTSITYSLPKDGNVKLTVYNAIGIKVVTIVDEYKPAGNYSVQFNGSNLASGIYMYRLEAENYSATKKLIILK